MIHQSVIGAWRKTHGKEDISEFKSPRSKELCPQSAEPLGEETSKLR